MARNAQEASEIARREFLDKPLTDADGTIEMRVSKGNIKKLTHGSAVEKSVSRLAHFQAVANLDHLIAGAREIHSGADIKALEAGRPREKHDIAAIRIFMAPMRFEDRQVGVALLVKETRSAVEANRIYTLEAMAIDGDGGSMRGPGPVIPRDGGGKSGAYSTATDRTGSDTDIEARASADKPLDNGATYFLQGTNFGECRKIGAIRYRRPYRLSLEQR
ncbi:hypothetical protein [Croceicoccus sp. YJ47]|uniref:LPD3 domain-containing protein n=1 Tax=Croceicoccus sp. YJ47 TaxID=2798724 RepID=UPI001F3F8049|nr:hypothetical protein [Croceicoccus sp. YJ47]